MITAIKQLGELKLKRDKKDILNILIEDPNKDGNYPKVLMIVLKKENDSFIFKEVKIEDTSSDKIEKYLYLRKASKGPDYTLTSKITEIEKFYENKVKGWFKSYSTYNEFFDKLYKAFKKSEESILKELQKKYKEVKSFLKKGKGCIFTIGIEEGDTIKYIGDFVEFREFLINLLKKELGKIQKENHICCVCIEKKEIVYGDAISEVFKFYTLDKPGYIAGGFKEKFAWKNAPLCWECFLKIKEGKKYMDSFLKWKMGGQSYYLIPKFIIGVKEIEEIIDTFFRYTTCPEEILKERVLEKISEDEKEILEELGKLKDVLTYNFLFFVSPNPQVFKINLLIEDVLPSRISKIFNVKREVEKIEIFRDENIKFRFDILKEFTPSQHSFFEVIDKTFRGLKFDTELLFSWFMERIREEFVKGSYYSPLVLKAFISLLFFKKLGILEIKSFLLRKGGGMIMDDTRKIMEDFFDKFEDTFYTPVHKAVFLLGVLTQKLLNIQFNLRSTTPFYKNLRGLRMKEEDFKGLFPKIVNKLEEYKKNYYRDLEELISIYFVEAGKKWNISTDELNFYFILGMSLHKKISEILKLKEEVEK